MSPPVRQEASLAEELAAMRRMLENHFRGDEASLRSMHEDLTALRDGLGDLDTRFQVHVERYAADQNNWRDRFGPRGSDGRPPEMSKIGYIALGAGIGGASLIEMILKFFAK